MLRVSDYRVEQDAKGTGAASGSVQADGAIANLRCWISVSSQVDTGERRGVYNGARVAGERGAGSLDEGTPGFANRIA